MRYKLKPVPIGSYIYTDRGHIAFRADSEAQARKFWMDYMPLDHDEINKRGLRGFGARPRVVYKRDVENGDCHEDAEPGDTTYDIFDLRDPEAPPGGVHVFWELGVGR